MNQIVNSPNAPAPIGPYNQSVLAGDTLYISGQIALNAATGELVNANIQEETTQVLENLRSIVEHAGMTMEDVVKCSVFVSDMHQYAEINKVYAEYFPEANAPARELVEVANLPKFVNVEISAIAVRS
jgi:2-iminobutanoate/2-iminopropanoate deaminase